MFTMHSMAVSLTRHSPQHQADALRQLLQDRREETEALLSLIEGVTSTLDLRELLHEVVELSARITSCRGALLYLWDEELQRLVVRAAVEGYEQWVDRFSLPIGTGLTGWTAMTRHPGIIRERPREDPRFLSVPEMNEELLQSFLTIPLIPASQRLLGVITMHTQAPREFTDDDLTLMGAIASLMASAIENAQLYGQRRRQVDVLRSLAETGQAVVSASSLPRILHGLAATARGLIEADTALVLVADDGRRRLRVEAATGDGDSPAEAPEWLPLAGGLAELVGASAPRSLTRRSHQKVFEQLERGSVRMQSALAAPIRVGDEALGVLMCMARSARSYSDEDHDLMSVVASQAALTLQNARLIDELESQNTAKQFLEALASGGESELTLSARARRLGCDLTQPHVVVRFEAQPDPSLPGDPDAAWATLRSELVGGFPGSVVSSRDLQLTVLLRVRESSAGEQLRARLARAMTAAQARGKTVVSAGVSGVCRGLADYQEGFEEAGQALHIGRAINGPGAVVRFAELGAQRHLWALSREQGRDRHQEMLYRLLDHDRRHGSQLFATVERYLEANGNRKAAADALFVHRNTLRQRFEKIRKVTGIDLDDSTCWFDLQVALRIIRFRELQKRP